MIYIKKIEQKEITKTIEYVMNFRRKLFTMIDNSKLPKDLANFEYYFMNERSGVWFNCYDDDQLIGTIGCLEYDYRFKKINVDENTKTSEVVKLFVDPSYRRQGLATKLFNSLKIQAKKQGIRQFYLHTHEWLTGAEQFWSKNGFQLLLKEIDGDMDIIHMIQKI